MKTKNWKKVEESDLKSDLDNIYELYINDLSISNDIKEEWFAFEGGKKLVTHYMRERNPEIVKTKKEQFKKKDLVAFIVKYVTLILRINMVITEKIENQQD